MAGVRFPHAAFHRRAREAHSLPEETLIRWLDDRTRAKRLAARAELRLRYAGRPDEMPDLKLPRPHRFPR